MHSLRMFTLTVAGGLFCLACAATSSGQQRVYSYVDENGFRVFTNIPPKNAPNIDPQVAAVTEYGATKNRLGEVPKKGVDTIIEKYADQYRLDPKLVHSMIASESAFNPRAVSHKGAQGLMQLMPGTASRLGVRDPFDPEDNIRGGMEHMRFLLDTFNNDLTLSLAAYNAGENLVQRIRRVPDFPETKAYVRAITSRYGRKDMAALPAQNTPRYPTMFKFVDGQGILHLTNIAPTQRADAEYGGFALSSQSPQ